MNPVSIYSSMYMNAKNTGKFSFIVIYAAWTGKVDTTLPSMRDPLVVGRINQVVFVSLYYGWNKWLNFH